MRILVFLLPLFLPGIAFGLTVQLQGSSPDQLPVIDFPTGDAQLPITLTIRNDAAEPQPILLWQLALVALPLDGATGELSYSAIEVPSEPFFGDGSAPAAFAELPSTSPVVSDFDYASYQVALDANSEASIVVLRLASNSAHGSFLIAAVPLNPSEVDSTSLWADDMENIQGFSNQIGPSELIELARVDVSGSDISPIGDYNGDGEVDAADYTVWRDGFGGVFTIEHYARWRTHFDASATDLAAVEVPENIPLAVILLGGMFVLDALVRRPSQLACS